MKLVKHRTPLISPRLENKLIYVTSNCIAYPKRLMEVSIGTLYCLRHDKEDNLFHIISDKGTKLHISLDTPCITLGCQSSWTIARNSKRKAGVLKLSIYDAVDKVRLAAITKSYDIRKFIVLDTVGNKIYPKTYIKQGC